MSANTSFPPNGCVSTTVPRDGRRVSRGQSMLLQVLLSCLCLLFTAAPLLAQAPQPSQGPDLGSRSAAPIQVNLNATGGNGTYAWSVVGGALPPGMVVRQVPFGTQWAIFGTPTTPDTYVFTLRVTSAGMSTDQVATLRITSLDVGTVGLETGFVGVPYSQQLIANSGGAAPTWAITSGSVAGITLSPSGLLSGTPTAATPAGGTNLTFTLSDGVRTVGRTLTLIVQQVQITTPRMLPNITSGVPYSVNIEASGGTAPYVFTASGLDTPGITLNSNGLLSGTSNGTGQDNFAVTATDNVGRSTTKNMAFMRVGSPQPLARINANSGFYSDCVLGGACSKALTAQNGGTPPFTWTFTGLPPGLRVEYPNTAGPFDVQLRGRPTTLGNYTVQATLTDSAGVISRNSFPLRVVRLDPRFSFPAARIETAFTGLMDVGGGTGPYTVELDSGQLPPGLTLNSSALTLTGTPTASGSFVSKLKFTDSLGATSFQERFMDVSGSAGAVSITTGYDLGVVGNGVPYSRTLTATGATTYVWTVEEPLNLPPGISLSSAGVLSGTPTANGIYSFLVKAANISSPAVNFGLQRFTLKVVPEGDVFIWDTSSNLPFGNVGTPYSFQIQASGDPDDIEARLAYGSFMPPGLSLNLMDGFITGTPTSPGNFQFTVEIVQAGALYSSQTFFISIYSPGAGTPINVTPGTVTLCLCSIGSHQLNLNATGGNGIYSWSFLSGTLPPGMRVRQAPFDNQWALQGVATTPGTYNFTLRINSAGLTANQPMMVRITPLDVGTTALPTAYVGVPYSHQMIANSGGASPTWTITSGSVTGVTISSSGVLSGTPTTATNGTNLTFSVSNGVDTVPRTLSLVVRQIQITTPRLLPNMTIGAPYSVTIQASGGTPPYTFTATGINTNGITMSSAGVLSGTTTNGPAADDINVTVTDSAGRSTTQAMGFERVISPQQPLGVLQANNVSGTTGFYTDCILGGSCDRRLSIALGGTPPFTWSVTGLPPGVRAEFPDTSGPFQIAFRGRPTTVGAYTVQATVTDAAGVTSRNSFPIRVSALDPRFNFPGTALNDVPFEGEFDVLGGSLPYSVSLSGGQLPPGLALNGSGLTLTGIATAAGTFTSRLRFVDALGATFFFERIIRILEARGPGGGLGITTGYDLGMAANGSPYSTTLVATGATAYTWTAEDPAELPPGLALAPNGVLSGTPSANGVYSFLVRVDDAIAPGTNWAIQRFTLRVVSPNEIFTWVTPATLPFGNVSTPYSLQIDGDGGPNTLTARLAYGSFLPPGLTLSTGGLLAGTPTSPGQFQFTVEVVNGAVVYATRQFTLTIYNTGYLPPIELPSVAANSQASVGQLTVGLTAIGGKPPYTYSITPGAPLIPGMRVQTGPPAPLNVTGDAFFMGVIPTSGTYSTSIRVTDSLGTVMDKAVTYVVVPHYLANVSPLPRAVEGVAYNYQLIAGGGSGSYTFSATGLPPGITINTNTGLLSGTPTQTGAFTNVVLGLRDTVTGRNRTNTYTLIVHPFAITTNGSLPKATVGTPYNQALSSPGCLSCVWSATGVPAGLTFSAGGVLSGIPTLTNNGAQITVTAAGSNGTAIKAFSLIIMGSAPTALSIVSTGAESSAGAPATNALRANGGTPPYNWTLESGSLPPGIQLSGSNEEIGANVPMGLDSLWGRGQSAGTYVFTLRVTDAAAATTTGVFTYVLSPLAQNYTPLPIAGTTLMYGLSYDQVLLGLGGTGVYTWTAPSLTNVLPPGLSLNAGHIVGRPTQPGTFFTQLRATDSGGATRTQNVTFNVAPGASVAPDSWDFPGSGGSQTFTVTALNPAVQWTVDIPPDITDLTANKAGATGTSTVILTVTPNPSVDPRSGSIVIAGQEIELSQAGATPVFTVTPLNWAAPITGGTQALTVTSNTVDATWAAVSNAAWVTVSAPGGEGSGGVTLTASPNPTASPRSTTVDVAGKVVTVTQVGAALPAVALAVTDGSASETGTNAGSLTFTRSGSVASPLVVTLSLGGTATNGVDYTTLGPTVTILAGQATLVVPVIPIDDPAAEASETVVVTIAANAAYTIGSPASGTVTIASEDPPTVSVVATDGAAGEAANPGVFTISRTGPTTAALTVSYAASGTATSVTDYTPALSGTVVIPIGAASAALTITPVNDTAFEGAETIVVTVTTTSPGYLVGGSPATVTIADNDLPQVTMALTDGAASEVGPDGGSVTLTRNGILTDPLVVTLVLTGTATNGTDYATVGPTVTIPAGQATLLVPVTPINDPAAEASETAIVTIGANALVYTIGAPATATVTIASEDPPTVTVVATDAAAGEAANPGVFTISRTGPTTAALTVSYTVSGSATSVTDYTPALSGTVVIPIGAASAAVTITPVNDTIFEGPETVVLTVTTASPGYLVGAPSAATVTIADNDLPAVTIAATDAAASEVGSDAGFVTLTRNGLLTDPLVVKLTLTGTATNGTDYATVGPTATIPAGQATVVVPVAPVNDPDAEASETAIVTIAVDALLYTIGAPANATVTIASEDLPTVTVVATDAAAGEAANPGVFTVSRTGPTTAALTVSYAVSGTATSVTDYTPALSGTVMIPIGATSAALPITPVNDTIFEGPETVVLTVTTASPGYLVGASNAATVTIADNDLPAVTIAATDAAASEVGSDAGSVTLTRNGLLTDPLVVKLTLSGTATNGTDYATVGPTATIPAGQATVVVPVTPVNDPDAEASETAIVTIAADALVYTIGAPTNATVTIASEDLPTVTVVATDAAAGEAANPGIFTVSRTGPTTAALTVSYALSGTASAGDYTPALTGTVVIPIGAASVAVPITPVNDTVFEGPETIVLTVTTSSPGYVVGGASAATVTIADNDLPAVTIAASDPNAGEVGPDGGSVTLTRNGILTDPLVVKLTLSGTATNGTDYTTVGPTVTIPAGQAAVVVPVGPINDPDAEANETAIVTIAADALVYTIAAPATATVTIASEDLPTVTVVATDAAAGEAANPGVFTVTRTGPTAAALTVSYALSGTASAGDYTPVLGGTVVIPIGAASAAMPITPVNDLVFEGAETVVLTVTTTSPGYLIGAASAATVTIADNDLPQVTIAATDAAASEVGPDGGSVTLTRNGILTNSLVVKLAFTGTAANGTDYTLVSSTATIPAGQATVVVPVTPINDPDAEASETAIVTIAVDALVYTIGAPTNATVTIASEDPPTVTVVATDATAGEAANPGVFTVSRTGPTTAALTVSYALSGTASAGDYTPVLSGTVVIPIGAPSAALPITPVNDIVFEGPETVVLTVTTASPGYLVGGASAATVTIADNDLPAVTIAATDAAASEVGPDGGSVTLTRTGILTDPVVVSLVLTGTATNGTDYATVGPTATIPAGQTTLVVPVTPINDPAAEANETAIVTIGANALVYTIGAPSSATVTIASEDPPTVTVVATDAAAGESANPGVFTVGRTGPTTAALTVSYTVGGTATSVTDYTPALSGTVVIPIGAASAALTLTPVNDTAFEGPETVMVTVTTSSPGYLVGASSTATVTIADNDLPAVTITATDAAASEVGPDGGSVTLTRTGILTDPLVVTLVLTGTATNGADYATVGPTATIPTGQATLLVPVAPINDPAAEANETAIVTIGANALVYTIAAPLSATVTIASEDPPTVTVVATDAAAGEAANPGVFTVSRTGPTTSALTVSYTVSGSATSVTDYLPALSGSVLIPIGAPSSLLTLTPVNDTVFEGPETVVLTVTTASPGYLIGAASAATVTIADNDLPQVTIALTDGDAKEEDIYPTSMRLGMVTVARNGILTSPLVVKLTTGGTATSGDDYLTVVPTVTIPAGQPASMVAVIPIDDLDAEANETVIVTVAADAAYTVAAPATATVTIASEDPPTVTVVATDAAAGEAANPGTFTLSRTGPTTSALTVGYSLSGTASAGDYAPVLGGTVVIPVGAASAAVTVTPVNDTAFEGPETVRVTLTPVSPQYRVGAASVATVTIADNDLPAVTITATDAAASEVGSDAGSVTLTRTGILTDPLVVTLVLTGTATNGVDYTTVGPTVTIVAGQATLLVPVTPINDPAAEASETAIVTVGANALVYTIGAPASATVTIASEDPPTVTVVATDATAGEAGPNPGMFTVTRTGPTTGALTVNYAVVGTAISGDYTPVLSGTVGIPIGAASTALTITPLNDTTFEGPETVTVTLLAQAVDPPYLVGLGGASGTVTITDNDLPQVTITHSGNAREEGVVGPIPGFVRLTRSGILTDPLVVTLVLTGTATNGTDYATVGPTATIPAGQATLLVPVTPIDDPAAEASETAIVTIGANALVYTIGVPATATVTIASEDPPTVTVVATDAAASEAPNTGTFTITRTGPTTAALTVSYTVGGTATSVTDYTPAPSGTVVIPIGAVSAALTITPVNDTAPEGDETIELTLSPGATYLVGGASTATVTIAANDMPTVTVTATDSNAAEPGVGENLGTFTVTRTGSTASELTVVLAVSGTATPTLDYVSLFTCIIDEDLYDCVTIPAGRASATVTVTPWPDVLSEGIETVITTVVDVAAPVFSDYGPYIVAAPNTATVNISSVP